MLKKLFKLQKIRYTTINIKKKLEMSMKRSWLVGLVAAGYVLAISALWIALPYGIVSKISAPLVLLAIVAVPLAVYYTLWAYRTLAGSYSLLQELGGKSMKKSEAIAVILVLGISIFWVALPFGLVKITPKTGLLSMVALTLLAFYVVNGSFSLPTDKEKRKRAIIVTPLYAVVFLMFFTNMAAVSPPSATPATVPPVSPVSKLPSMAVEGTFHEIHTQKLQLKCTQCHTQKVETYYDPLAQVSNLADRRACLSCHKEGTLKEWYGTNWQSSAVNKELK